MRVAWSWSGCLKQELLEALVSWLAQESLARSNGNGNGVVGNVELVGKEGADLDRHHC